MIKNAEGNAAPLVVRVNCKEREFAERLGPDGIYVLRKQVSHISGACVCQCPTHQLGSKEGGENLQVKVARLVALQTLEVYCLGTYRAGRWGLLNGGDLA